MFVIFDILITVFHVLLEAVSLAMLVRMLLPLFLGMGGALLICFAGWLQGARKKLPG